MLIETFFGKGANETSNATKIVRRSSPVVSNLSDSSTINFSLNLLRVFSPNWEECKATVNELHLLQTQ